MIVLGFGMAVTVAPLTTVVMNSVNQDRVGAASGINNAVARLASVLAVAVLGIVMVKAFGLRLNSSLAHLMIPADVLRDLRANEMKLAGLQAPSGLSSSMETAVTGSIRAAFVFGFRTIMLICAALAVASTAVTWFVIPKIGTARVARASLDGERGRER